MDVLTVQPYLLSPDVQEAIVKFRKARFQFKLTDSISDLKIERMYETRTALGSAIGLISSELKRGAYDKISGSFINMLCFELDKVVIWLDRNLAAQFDIDLSKLELLNPLILTPDAKNYFITITDAMDIACESNFIEENGAQVLKELLRFAGEEFDMEVERKLRETARVAAGVFETE